MGCGETENKREDNIFFEANQTLLDFHRGCVHYKFKFTRFVYFLKFIAHGYMISSIPM